MLRDRGSGEGGLKAQGLGFAYRGITVLLSLDLELHPGEWLVLLGPNGAGKSTLLRLMAGLLKTQSGQVMLQGKPLGEYSSWQLGQHIAFLSQNGAYPEDLTAEEVVRLGRTPYLGLLGREGKADLEAVEWAMTQTQTLEFRQRLLATLSGGERRRVMLARALASQPRYLLLDEPTAHLDLHHQAEFLCLLEGLRRQGIGILTVLHDPNLAYQANRVAFLCEGVIKAVGSTNEVIREELLTQVYGRMVRVCEVDGRPVVLLG